MKFKPNRQCKQILDGLNFNRQITELRILKLFLVSQKAGYVAWRVPAMTCQEEQSGFKIKQITQMKSLK